MNKNILKGKKIGITAIDLEQAEHRGIAAVTKSLIALLCKYGAEVYLITGIGPKRISYSKRRNLNKNLFNEIFISDLLKMLQKGSNYREDFKKDFKYRIDLGIKLLKVIFTILIRNFNFKYKVLTLSEDHKSINVFDTRLDYVNNIKGFIYSPEIFSICRLKSMRLILNTPKLNIKKNDLDLIITSCPLSLKGNNKSTKIIQLIHDAIPIQVWSHPESPITFYNRLKDAHKYSSCIYVSKQSKKIVRGILNLEIDNKDSNDIFYPLPSLTLKNLQDSFCIPSIRSIDKPFILFNSSIVERKRVEKTINYFKKSNLIDRNFVLCIAGKIHKSKYSKLIKKICKENKNIMLLDYVTEIEKVWLFLNSSLLISTSSTEGFGVPILDALAINLPTVATNIPTYKEIKSFLPSNNLELLEINEEKKWLEQLNNIKLFDFQKDDNKKERIDFFQEFLEKFEEINLNKIKSYLNN